MTLASAAKAVKAICGITRGLVPTTICRTIKSADSFTAAALFPLYVNAAAKIAPRGNAAAVHLLLQRRAGYHLRLKRTAVGCAKAPLQWVAAEGLQIMGRMTWQWKSRSAQQCAARLRSREKLVEKYDASAVPEPAVAAADIPFRTAFGWTNGVTLKMLDLICSQEKPCDSVPSTHPASLSATPTKTRLRRRSNACL